MKIPNIKNKVNINANVPDDPVISDGEYDRFKVLEAIRENLPWEVVRADSQI